MTTHALTVALIALVARTAPAADINPPPSAMQGGEAVAFVESVADQPDAGEGTHVTVGEDRPGIIVRGREDSGTTTQIIELKTPAVTATRYVIKGWVQYAGVDGAGYLEMLSRFDGVDSFTRTLGERGPMGKIAGDSKWRVFTLPFNADAGMRPEHLSVNVVLPGKGEVTITDVRLVQFGNDGDAATTSPAKTSAISSPPLSPPSTTPPLKGLTTTSLLWSAVVLVVCLVIASAVLRRRRRRHETITNELRRIHALDAA